LRFLLKKANKDILQISRGISFHIDGDVILTFLTALQCAKRTLQISAETFRMKKHAEK